VECNSENPQYPNLINMGEVINSEPKFKKCFEKFTKNWYIAETLDDAMKISWHKNEKRNIVTLKGEIFKSGGEIKSQRTNAFSICIKTKLEDELIVFEDEDHSNKTLNSLKNELSELETQIGSLNSKFQNINEFQFKKLIHENNKEKMVWESKRDRLSKRIEQNETIINELIEKNLHITLNSQELNRFEILKEKMKQKFENEKKSIKFIQRNKSNVERMIMEETFKLSKLSSSIEQNESSEITLSKEIKEIQTEIKHCKIEMKKLVSNHNPEIMKSITKKLNMLEEELNELIQTVNKFLFK
jgi:chromosome segregation protein